MGCLSKMVKVGAVIMLSFDALWFLRFVGTMIVTKFWKSKVKPLDESKVYSICTTHDLDFMGHMNNARYFRDLDFGRMDFYLRSGLTKFIQRQSSVYVVQHACTIRYRRSVNFLRPYVVITRIIWWDCKSLYFEQKIVTLHDGFVRAIAISKNAIVNADVEQMMREIFKMADVDYEKPEPRGDLVTWIEYNHQSSELLWKEISSGGKDRSGDKMTSMRSFCVSPAPIESENFNRVGEMVQAKTFSENLLKPH